MIFCGLLITLRERTWYSLSHRDRAARGGGRWPTPSAWRVRQVVRLRAYVAEHH